ncbi:hypothetical protein PM10SUCC1_29810 [Propionigenium maris DSM 9537]|uniref:DUF7305 domain-containing protein n=1 Tax=Propionigenium maris DSM 9537 TaxID=1123000 RepID=A0A9W6LPD3_9FUSO|nr:hypothetical protein [Propionigenium maris]GLI57467.1 hypothetical protein PM10SUCC1_29810 [Propionigenium maris DSM 9537]
MKKGFILPVVMILMTMLMAVSLVLSKVAEDKTKSLKAQESGYYTEKKITIELEKNDEIIHPGKKLFQDVINIYNGEGIEFKSGGHTRKSTNGRFARIKANISNSCRLVGGVEGNNFECDEDTELLTSSYSLPSINFGGSIYEIGAGTEETLIPGARYEEFLVKGTAILPRGVYYIKKLVVDGGKIILGSGANVKIYSEEAIDIKGSVNTGGNPSQLLIVNKGSSDTKVTGSSRVNGFFYTESKVVLDGSSEVYGALITGGLAQISSNSFIEYDEAGAAKFKKEHITEKENIGW